MLSKDLLTRWNAKAIIHAKARDLERCKALPRPRRNLIDPRCFAVGDVLTDQGANVAPAYQTPGATGVPNFTTNGTVRSDRNVARQAFARTFDYNNRRVFGVCHARANSGINIGLSMLGSAAGGLTSTSEWTASPSAATGADGSDATIGTAQTITTASGAGAGVTISPPSTGGTDGLRRDLQWWLWIHFKSPTAMLTNCRQWFGVFFTNPISPASDTIPLNSAGFRFSTVAGDTAFQCITKDGATANTQSSGITVANSTEYILEILVNASNNIEFYINNALVATSSANLPSLSVAYTSIGLYHSAPAAGTQNVTWTQIMFAKD